MHCERPWVYYRCVACLDDGAIWLHTKNSQVCPLLAFSGVLTLKWQQ